MNLIVRKFDTPGWHNSVVLFLIYCAEIHSLLLFALLGEPLNLIYAINRVIQVSAGAIESNLKTFLHKLQGYSQNEPANGIVRDQPFVQPVSSENAFVDNNSPR